MNSRTLLSLLAAESVLLSVLHHRYNFWGWPWDKQALIILLVALGLAYVLQFLLAPIWPDLLRIGWRRWVLFLLPAVGIAALAAWHYLAVPETQHELVIVPSAAQRAGDFQLLEIKGAYGNEVPLSSFSNIEGWTIKNGVLVSDNPAPQPIRYSFAGPVGEQMRVTFLESPLSGHVQVVLDGKKVDLNLAGQDGDQKRVRLDTQYRWGILNFLIVPLLIAIDMLALICMLGVLWLIQEIPQYRRTVPAAPGAERFLSHRDGLLVLCLLGLVLHAIHFLAVPLAVLKDSPSFLQGAVYWIQHHSLDGVSSYRGPGTTFLFTPVMLAFGRNAWGLKLLLHGMALGCIPLSYGLGWQLGRRRWFAFSVGLLTALLPDLYAYSSFVLSEVPNVLFGLLYCTLLISSMETKSPGWIAAAALAGSFAVLVRSENFAALSIGTVFMLSRLLWERPSGTLTPAEGEGLVHKSPVRVWQFILPVLIGAGPLLAWSAHNSRNYDFFGISDYGGEILYDGWIYFGESSRIAITDQNSPAILTIHAAYQSGSVTGSKIPTGWDIYHSLRVHGYTSEQAFSLLQQAAFDSIRKDLSLTWRLLVIKIREGFEPHTFIPATFTLPGESPPGLALNADYFNDEGLRISPLIHLQRFINGLLGSWYQNIFAVWFWLGLTMIFISVYRRPSFKWLLFAAIATNSIFLPTILGMSMWRYVLFGLALLPIFILAGVKSMGEFISLYLQAFGSRKPHSA